MVILLPGGTIPIGLPSVAQAYPDGGAAVHSWSAAHPATALSFKAHPESINGTILTDPLGESARTTIKQGTCLMDRTKGITVSSWPVLFLLPLLIVSIHGAAEARATAGAETGRPKQVPAGTWGGKGVLLDVREDGARIELVCAHGTIDGPIKLEKDESFHTRG